MRSSTSISSLYTVNSANADFAVTSSTTGNGVSTALTYDGNTGLLTNVRAGPSDAVAAFDYGYDLVGNLTARADDHESVFERFCYDALDRLQYAATGSSGPASCTSGAITKSVAYDALGNITAKSDVGSYGYPAPGSALPHAVSAIAGTVNGVVNPTYGYDADGNLTSGAGRTVTYTPFNRTASIVQGAAADCLAYDSDHARIKMERRAAACAGTLGSTTYYLNDPVSGAMSEKNVAGSTVTWTDYLTAGGRLIAQRTAPSGGTPAAWGGFAWGAGTWSATASTWTYFTLDRLGSIAVLTGGAGTVIERDSYDAWGRRRNSDGTDNPSCSITSSTTRGFTGHEMLDTVCQVNANARLYDPTIARFMSPDSVIPDAYDGQSFNRYSYVENGPLSATDPTGNVNNLPPRVRGACTWGCAQGSMPCWGCIGPGLDSDSNGLPVPAAWSGSIGGTLDVKNLTTGKDYGACQTTECFLRALDQALTDVGKSGALTLLEGMQFNSSGIAGSGGTTQTGGIETVVVDGAGSYITLGGAQLIDANGNTIATYGGGGDTNGGGYLQVAANGIPQVTLNRLQGLRAEDQAESELIGQGFTVVRYVSFRDPATGRTAVIDMVAHQDFESPNSPTGKTSVYVFEEVKSGNGQLTMNQAAVATALQNGTAIPIGPNARAVGLIPGEPTGPQVGPVFLVTQGYQGH